MVVDQEEIHRLSLSQDVEDRKNAVKMLKDNFEFLPDKTTVWNDVIILLNDNNSYVRWNMILTLGLFFKYVPDKYAAWDILQIQINNKDRDVRSSAAFALGSAFKFIPEEFKYIAWKELHRITFDEDLGVRVNATSAIGSVFEYIPEEFKFDIWKDLHRLTTDKHSCVRSKAAHVLMCVFSYIPDKSVAWKDMIRLISDEDCDVQRSAAFSLGSSFSLVPDKFAAFDDLARLTMNNDLNIRWYAVTIFSSILESVISSDSDRDIAADSLVRITNDENLNIKLFAINTIRFIFIHIPDKANALSVLHRLTMDNCSSIRETAVDVLGFVFVHIPPELSYNAWEDIIGLVNDKDWYVRYNAGKAIAPAFKHVADKYSAWGDLHSLTSHKEDYMRENIAHALGYVFGYIPDELKSVAWDDLIKLTEDNNYSVRVYANHSLGKICIHNASKSESKSISRDFLKEAIHYFERSVGIGKYKNPSIFCSIFYRTFDAVFFKKAYSKNEIDNYIISVKYDISNSSSKLKLIEAVEQLAEVLEIAHNAKELGIDHQELLKKCSDICNRVDELMLDNKENTPAIFEIYEKNKPSFKKNIKELIDELKEKAKITCKETQGTPAEGVACSINKEIQKWKIESQEDMEKNFHNLIDMMRIMVPDIPANHLLISKINSIEDYTKPEDVFGALGMIFPLIKNMSLSEDINYIKSTVDEIKVDVKQVDMKIDNLSINVEQVTKQIMEQPNPQEYLDLIQQILENIQDEIPEMKDDIKKVLDDLYSPLRIERKLKISIPLIPLFMSYEAQVTPSKFVGDRIFEFKRLYSKLKI